MRHILLSFIMLLTPIVIWGQNRLVLERISRANEIKASKGVCLEYVDALQVASDEAIKENDMSAALEIQKELVASLKQVFPENIELICSSEAILATLYLMSESYSDAYPLLKDSYAQEKGTDVSADLESLELLSHTAYKLNLYQEAIHYRKDKIDLILKHQGKDELYAENVYLLSLLFIEIQDLDKALKYVKEAILLFQELNQTKSNLYLRATQTLKDLDPSYEINDVETWQRQVYSLMKQYFETNDVSFIQSAISILDALPDNEDVVEHKYHALSSLYLHYLTLNDDRKAIETILQLPYMRSNDWHAMGRAMNNIGDFLNAKDSYKYAWAFSFNENQDVTDKFFSYLESYAQACINTGDYQEIFGYLESFYATDSKVKGFEMRAALYMYVLAQLKHSIGDFSGAVYCAGISGPLFKKAGIYDEYKQCLAFEIDHYERVGDYKKCIELINNLIESCADSDEAMMYRACLPFFHYKAGNENNAKNLYDEIVLEESKHVFRECVYESGFMHSLGLYAATIEDNPSAEKYLIKSIKSFENVKNSDHINYSVKLLALASLYISWKGYEDKALLLCEQAYEIVKTHYDANFPSYFAFSLSDLYAKYVNDVDVSKEKIIAVINDEKVQAQNLLCQMTENERASFWKNHDVAKDLVFSLKPSSSILYDYTLFYKGILLSSTRQIGRIVQIAKDSELNSIYGKYVNAKQLSQNSSDAADQIRTLERQLLARCKELGYAINESLSFSDIANSLAKNEVAIEFVDYKKMKTVSDTLESSKYVALIIKKGWDVPQYVELCDGDELEELVKKQDRAYSDKAMYDLLWKPLEKYITKSSKVYYSPAGLTHKVAFDAIKVDNKRILADKYDLHRLSSTRELIVINPTDYECSSSVVYGGLLYNVPSEEFVKNSQEYACQLGYASSGYLHRGSASGSPWRFLPGTRNEAEAISGLLRSKNVDCNLYVGSAGNEESFKSLSGNSPSIIHIATHGFYLEPNQNTSQEVIGGLRGQLLYEESALRRSGLIMSGANAAWVDGASIPNVDDGVLTAEEISQMDLRNTLLAVVSSCESGLGNITNDGIEGLVRGFKSAGVKSIIVTLWKVDDAATELMMTEFYKALMGGCSQKEAFNQARNKVKSIYEEPFYWAPFVLID